LDAWATILRQIPQSRLVLHAHHGSHRQQTFDFFARFGIEASRIEFVAAQPYAEHLRTYHQIDVTLDPFPYAGGITSLDSLWMGVPFVTLAGNQPVGRGGCSILSNIALPELIAHDHEQYISKTLHLAGDLPRLQHLRQSLRATMEHSPLMDAPTFAQNVEAAYRQMWRRWSEKH
jgi:predicted O-linked N-acetylglucosamine transferase (SPINDLY family)